MCVVKAQNYYIICRIKLSKCGENFKLLLKQTKENVCSDANFVKSIRNDVVFVGMVVINNEQQTDIGVALSKIFILI